MAFQLNFLGGAGSSEGGGTGGCAGDGEEGEGGEEEEERAGEECLRRRRTFTFLSMGNLTRLALLAPTEDVCIGLKYFTIRFLRFYL